MKTTFIYALKELKDGEYLSTKIRYIGKANDPYRRFEYHCRCKAKSHLGYWIRSLPARGFSLQLEVLDEIPEDEWEFWEREYIRVFRAIGFNLVNATDGGGGLSNPSLETRAKMGAGGRSNRGKKFSLEHRAKIGAAHRGRKYSADTLARMSEAARGNKRCAGRKLSAETRAKISASQKARWTRVKGLAGKKEKGKL